MKQVWKRFILVAILLCCRLVSWPSPATASPPIVFGLSLGLTGKYAESAAMQEKGKAIVWPRHLQTGAPVIP